MSTKTLLERNAHSWLRYKLPQPMRDRLIMVGYDSCCYTVTFCGSVSPLHWHDVRIPTSMWGTDAAIAKICLEVP